MNDDEKDVVVEAAKFLMLEAMTMEESVGTEVTVAALLSCAATLALDGAMSPRRYADIALASVEGAYPDACDAAEDWRP